MRPPCAIQSLTCLYSIAPFFHSSGKLGEASSSSMDFPNFILAGRRERAQLSCFELVLDEVRGYIRRELGAHDAERGEPTRGEGIVGYHCKYFYSNERPGLFSPFRSSVPCYKKKCKPWVHHHQTQLNPKTKEWMSPQPTLYSIGFARERGQPSAVSKREKEWQKAGKTMDIYFILQICSFALFTF